MTTKIFDYSPRSSRSTEDILHQVQNRTHNDHTSFSSFLFLSPKFGPLSLSSFLGSAAIGARNQTTKIIIQVSQAQIFVGRKEKWKISSLTSCFFQTFGQESPSLSSSSAARMMKTMVVDDGRKFKKIGARMEEDLKQKSHLLSSSLSRPFSLSLHQILLLKNEAQG